MAALLVVARLCGKLASLQPVIDARKAEQDVRERAKRLRQFGGD
jgi:hypothetical protein